MFRHNFLEIMGLTAQILHLVSVRRTCRIARKAPLSGFHEVLGPFVVNALRDTLTAAQLCNAVFTTQTIQNDPDLLFG
ncbi:hypothetical protein FHS72_003727 [Loktanella ponticola]|uniref:Uncharacterized protein n=1 Tax=Yoonia ponticola TaxID=1524255 RepID=A0A7W9F1L0_9RHOB|nr:hypothetical protein [Yoonia ponticola]